MLVICFSLWLTYFHAGIQPLWEEVVGHFVEVITFYIITSHFTHSETCWHHHYKPVINMIRYFLQLANSPNHHLRAMALNALDQSISAVLGSDQFEEHALSRHLGVCENVPFLCLSIQELHFSLLKKNIFFVTRAKQKWRHLKSLWYLHFMSSMVRVKAVMFRLDP